jgi:hypothetical protein
VHPAADDLDHPRLEGGPVDRDGQRLDGGRAGDGDLQLDRAGRLDVDGELRADRAPK